MSNPITNRKEEISPNKRIVFSVLMVLIILFAIMVSYGGFSIYRTAVLYSYIKSSQRGWKGHVHKPDPELGFSPIPNSAGAHIFPIGPEIPMRYDSDGFRIPVEGDTDSVSSHSVILALGCSFTYGDATKAEDTYPYLVGKYLKGRTKNAGVCSYGLSQMLILAKKLVPYYKPDYLLVQYSSWLEARATKQFADSYYGKIPNPYFFKNDGFELHQPVFLTAVMDLPIDRYRDSVKNTPDMLSFCWNVGMPLFLHDDFNMALLFTKKILGIIPEPTSSHEELIKYVYKEISNIAKVEGAEMVIVVLGNKEKQLQIPQDFFQADTIVVDAQGALLAHMPVVDRELYDRLYRHWRGTPPIMVDRHPNEKAHKIIAEAIVRKIKESELQ